TALERLPEDAAETAPPLLVHELFEGTLHLEEVDGNAVLGREHLRGEDREPRERERAGDLREQPGTVLRDDREPVGPRARARLRLRPDIPGPGRGLDQM